MDTGEERIEDVLLRERLRRQARKVYAKSLLAAALLTALFVVV